MPEGPILQAGLPLEASFCLTCVASYSSSRRSLGPAHTFDLPSEHAAHSDRHRDAVCCTAGPSSVQRENVQSSADDRFGEWDIITGKRVRDLRLEPVLQLAQWQQSIFGSRDSVSESMDEGSPERERSR